MDLKRTVVAVLVIILVAPLGLALEKEPVTHEAIWLMKRVGPPIPSPDGRWVIFSLTEPSYEGKEVVNDLWIVPSDGSAEPRRLTSGKSGENGAAWSPDSRRIAFTAKRDDDESSQLYVLDFARGGEAQRITKMPLGAGNPVWSPDGSLILFESAVYPGASSIEEIEKEKKTRKDRKTNVHVYESFPIRQWDSWVGETTDHLWVVDSTGKESPRNLIAGTELAGTQGFRGGYGATWSPDGNSVIFSATTDLNLAAHAKVRSHLYQLSFAGGEPVALTSGTWSYGDPSFRPDGNSLCFSMEDEGDDVYMSLSEIGCAAWPWDGRIVNLTKDFDRNARGFAYSPDGKTIFFTANDAGHTKIWSVPARGGEVRLAVDAPSGVYGGLRIPSKTKDTILLANWESAVQPQEIARIDARTGKRTMLTRFNEEKAASLDWQPLREFWYDGPDGKKIHSFMALPAGFDEANRYPVFVLMHGGHAGMWQDAIHLRWNYHLLTRPGVVLIAPDYRGSVGYGLEFTLDILGDPLRGPADDINAAVDAAIAMFPFIDGKRTAAGGASYGGHLANWLEATTDRYDCIVSHAGLASLDMQWATSDGIYHREMMMGGPFWEDPETWLDQSPLRHGGNFKTPMLLSVGQNDYRVPINNTLAMWSVLQRMNVPGRLLVFPEENHWIMNGHNSRLFYDEVMNWLGKWLAIDVPEAESGGPETETSVR